MSDDFSEMISSDVHNTVAVVKNNSNMVLKIKTVASRAL
jgi:Mg2+ and Co2+ transporter CorA